MRVFLLQDRLKACGGKSAGELRHVHVVGAGVMGGDIAAWCALRGFTVTLQDRAAEYIEPALKRARELFDKRVRDPAEQRRGAGAPDAPTSPARALPRPTWSSRPSSRISRPSRRCTRSSSRA